MEKQAEEQIIREVLNGDYQRFALLVDAYKGPVFNLAYRMTGSYSDAEDLAQESFLRAFEHLGRYDPGRKFFTWLYTIALNLIRTHLRQRMRANPPAPPGTPSVNQAESPRSANPEAIVMEEEAVLEVNRALLRLTDDLRELIVLRFYQGLSFDAIADILCISQSAAKMRVYRGLKRLRVLMKKQAK